MTWIFQDKNPRLPSLLAHQEQLRRSCHAAGFRSGADQWATLLKETQESREGVITKALVGLCTGDHLLQ